MSQATPWTVGPSASRDFEPPAAADDPMLQIAASAHAKIAGHNGLGNPKMVRGQRGRFTGSASAPALHREFTLSTSANEVVQNRLGQGPSTVTLEVGVGAVRGAAQSQAKELVASRQRAARASPPPSDEVDAQEGAAATAAAAAATETEATTTADVSSSPLPPLPSTLPEESDPGAATAAAAEPSAAPASSAEDESHPTGADAAEAKIRERQAGRRCGGGSSSAPMLPAEGAAMDAEMSGAPRASAFAPYASDGSGGGGGAGSGGGGAASGRGGNNPFARLKAVGPLAEAAPVAAPPLQQQTPPAWTVPIKGRVPSPTPLQLPWRPEPGRLLNSPPSGQTLRPLPLYPAPMQPVSTATVPLADDEVLVGSVASVAQRNAMATIGIRDGRPPIGRAVGRGARPTTPHILITSASAPPTFSSAHEPPAAPSSSPRAPRACPTEASASGAGAAALTTALTSPPPQPLGAAVSASMPVLPTDWPPVDGGTRGGPEFRASAFGRTLEPVAAPVPLGGTGLHASLSAVAGTTKQKQPRSELQTAPPPPRTQQPPMAAVTHSAQLVGRTSASCAEPRGSQMLPLRVCGALTTAPRWQEGWEWFGWEVCPFDERAAEVAAAVDVGAEWVEEAEEAAPREEEAERRGEHVHAAPREEENVAVPPPPVAKLALNLEVKSSAPSSSFSEGGEGGEGGGGGECGDVSGESAAVQRESRDASPSTSDASVDAAAVRARIFLNTKGYAEPDVESIRPLGQVGGKELLKAIYAHAVRLSEKTIAVPSTSSRAGPPAPLLRHALGKPAGCLCLELCEPGAYDALRAAYRRLARSEGLQPGGPAQTIRELLPMLDELRHRVAVGRVALQRLSAVLPPPPAGAAPTASLAIGLSLLSMASSSSHPGAEAARQAAPEVAAALELWNCSGLTEAATSLAADLSLHAHTLAHHLSKSMPKSPEGELLPGITQMPPHLAVVELCTPAHLECFRRIATWADVTPEPPGPGTNQVPTGMGLGLRSGVSKNVSAACASMGSAAPPNTQWAQLLAQQLLCTLWRLYRCGALTVPIDLEVLQTAELLEHQHRRARQALLEQERRERIGQPSPPPPGPDDLPDERDSPYYGRHLRAVCVLQALHRQRQLQVQKQKQQAALHRLGHETKQLAKRTTGAAAPTFTMATSNPKPAKRPAPQGALHRLGQERPAGPKLPFLTALIVPPKANFKDGEVPRMELYHSVNAPGYVHFSS